jgi:ubiquinone/menaquinone biosynthesis C-methylase UbiE
MVVDAVADSAFQVLLRRTFPHSYEWDNRYVEHEMSQIHHVFQSGICPVDGSTVLEFGCNIGATSIVVAHAGAVVVGCDVSSCCLELARLNIRRYGVSDSIRLVRAAQTGALPFGDGTFDVIVCNSVLEYLPTQHLRATLRDLDRILRLGGYIVIHGTSNRLWPLEPHGQGWFVNYLPRAVDRITGVALQRGVWPSDIQWAFGHYEDVLHGRGVVPYLKARNATTTGLRTTVLKCGWHTCRLLGIRADFATPWLAAVMRKQPG